MADRRNHSWSYNKTPCHLYFDHEESLAEAADTPDNIDNETLLLKEPYELRQSGQSATPTPYLQILFIVCFRASVPFTFAVIMPFINELLVRDLQVSDETDVGRYSGPVEMASSLGTLSGIFVWARLSDVYGRKPVVMIGVGLSAVCCSIIGFARRYWLLILLRHAQGFFSAAAAATVKVMVTDISDSTNLTKHFALIGTGFQIGAAAAPVIGGLLARPASTWPAIFKSTLFETRPYALPMLVAAFLPATVVLFAMRFFRETHHTTAQTVLVKKLHNEKTYPTTESQESLLEHEKPLIVLATRLLTRGTMFILALWFLTMFQINALFACQILFFSSSSNAGGLSLKPSQIALFLGLRPFLVSIWEVKGVPILSAKYGHTRLFKTLICIPPLTNLLYAILSSVLSATTMPTVVLVPALGLSLALHVLSNPVFLCLDILISQRSPSPERLSDLYAVAEVIAQLAIGTGAATGSWLFSLSACIEGPFRYRLVWLVLIAVNVFAAALARKLSTRSGP